MPKAPRKPLLLLTIAALLVFGVTQALAERSRGVAGAPPNVTDPSDLDPSRASSVHEYAVPTSGSLTK